MKSVPQLTVAERLGRIITGKENVVVLISEIKAELMNIKNEMAELQKLMGN
jgi:hypothetical protein